MSRKRHLSTDISTDEKINRMGMKYGDWPVLLYTWLIPHAGDDGTITARPFELLNIVFPGRRDKQEEDIVSGLAACIEFGLLQVVDDTIYFPTHSFYRYQSYIPKDKRRHSTPEPRSSATAQNTDNHRQSPTSSEHQRITPIISEEQRESAQITVSPSPSPSLSPSPSPSPGREGSSPLRGSDPSRAGAAEGSPEGGQAARDAESVRTQDIIRELGDHYRTCIPPTKHQQQDYAVIGKLYHDVGPEAVEAALEILRQQAPETIDRPLNYVAAIARRWSRDPPSPGHKLPPTMQAIRELWQEVEDP